MKTETLVLPTDNRRKLVKFLQVEFSAKLFIDKCSHFDPEYIATIPQMEKDVKQIVGALSSKETNELWIEDFISTYSQVKPFVALLEKAIAYLVSKQWKPKEDWLTVESKKEQIIRGYPDLKYTPRDKDIDTMHGDLVQIINLLH